MNAGWGLLVPKGWAGVLAVGGVIWGVLGAIRFQDTITVGSILIAALVIVAGGVFTFRNNMRTFWRNLAEERAEQIKVLEQRGQEKDAQIIQLQEAAKAELAKTADEQRAIRHELKNQIAELRASLRVEQTKTDLTSLLEQLATQHAEAMEKQDKVLHSLETIPAVSLSDLERDHQ
jgi:murein L,D-transpeptidase YcbB/YkuD